MRIEPRPAVRDVQSHVKARKEKRKAERLDEPEPEPSMLKRRRGVVGRGVRQSSARQEDPSASGPSAGECNGLLNALRAPVARKASRTAARATSPGPFASCMARS